MRAIGSIIVASLGACICTPAFAGKNDDAWAACVWRAVPTSAANWLTMPEPKRDYGLQTPPPEYVLQFRLQASCYKELTPAGKDRPPSFSAKSVRAALVRLRPATVGPDMLDPKAFRCARYFLNDTEHKTPAGYDWGFGDDLNAKQFFSVQFFFASEKGGSVGLPDGGGLRKCSFIQENGAFVDA